MRFDVREWRRKNLRTIVGLLLVSFGSTCEFLGLMALPAVFGGEAENRSELRLAAGLYLPMSVLFILAAMLVGKRKNIFWSTVSFALLIPGALCCFVFMLFLLAAVVMPTDRLLYLDLAALFLILGWLLILPAKQTFADWPEVELSSLDVAEGPK